MNGTGGVGGRGPVVQPTRALIRTIRRPQKFVNWLTTTQRAYPSNPHMMLFVGLAHRLLGHDAEAERCTQRAASFVDNGYWRDRFASFHLEGLLTDFPSTADGAQRRLPTIWRLQKQSCADWLAVPQEA